MYDLNILKLLTQMKSDMYKSMKWEYNRTTQSFEPEFVLNTENEKTLLTMALNPTHLIELLKIWPLYVKNPDYPCP